MYTTLPTIRIYSPLMMRKVATLLKWLYELAANSERDSAPPSISVIRLKF